MIRALLLATLLTGCTIPIALPGIRTCQAENAIGYVGQRYTDRIAHVVKGKARATHVRAIAPGMVVTQEFRANRVNLVIDERKLVTRIYCG